MFEKMWEQNWVHSDRALGQNRQKIGFLPISPPGRDLKGQTLVLSQSMDSVDTLQVSAEKKTPSTAQDIKYTL